MPQLCRCIWLTPSVVVLGDISLIWIRKMGFCCFVLFFYLKVHISLRLNVEMCEIPECLSFVGCSCSDCWVKWYFTSVNGKLPLNDPLVFRQLKCAQRWDSVLSDLVEHKKTQWQQRDKFEKCMNLLWKHYSKICGRETAGTST